MFYKSIFYVKSLEECHSDSDDLKIVNDIYIDSFPKCDLVFKNILFHMIMNDLI